MDEKDKQILRQNRTYLVSSLHDTHNICEDLYSCDILTESMRSEIMAESTLIKQNRKLLDILPKRGKQAFQSFLEALVNNGQRFLADKLDPVLAATLVSNDNPNPPIVIQQESTKQPADEANKSSSLTISQAGQNPSLSGKETAFQAVHGPKGVQPEDVRRQKEVCRQESQPLSIQGLVENFDTAFGSKDFSIAPWDDSKARNLSQSHKHYSMPRRPNRGRVLIISNTDFKNLLPERPQQSNFMDSSRLIQMFNDLEFKVLPNKTDLDLKATREILEMEAKRDHSKSDCFILAILSHGKGSSIYTADGKLFSIQEIVDIFNDTRAPSLKGKPKIFIIQAAEHSDMNRHDSVSSDLVDLNDRLADLRLGDPVNENVTDTKDVLDQPRSPDTFVVLGTAGYSTSHGSYFIQVLANYISKLVYECHLEEIIKKVNSIDVQDKDKELCVHKSSLTKDFYFYTSL